MTLYNKFSYLDESLKKKLSVHLWIILKPHFLLSQLQNNHGQTEIFPTPFKNVKDLRELLIHSGFFVKSLFFLYANLNYVWIIYCCRYFYHLTTPFYFLLICNAKFFFSLLCWFCHVLLSVSWLTNATW